MQESQTPDDIYAKPHEEVNSFAFDENVARVFKDMINRSVPGYQTVLGMLGVFAKEYAQEDTCIYDLGCSLGASTLMLRQHTKPNNCSIVAIDNAPAMVKRCKANLGTSNSSIPVEVICADIRHTTFKPSSLVSLNFTLQFLSVEDRLPLLSRIYDSLKPGGALVIAEKVSIADNATQEWNTKLHHEFKKANGYSDLEVAQKRSALENVLIPESISSHESRLKQAGFTEIHCWFHCLNFAAFIAIK